MTLPCMRPRRRSAPTATNRRRMSPRCARPQRTTSRRPAATGWCNVLPNCRVSLRWHGSSHLGTAVANARVRRSRVAADRNSRRGGGGNAGHFGLSQRAVRRRTQRPCADVPRAGRAPRRHLRAPRRRPEGQPAPARLQLAAADLLVCQAGRLNHNAYARVKAHCKRSGKPCVYLDKRGPAASPGRWPWAPPPGFRTCS